MQGGVHLFMGLLLALLNRSKGFKIGVVFGSILPDFDIIPTSLVIVLTRDLSYIHVLHRTYLHSLLSVVVGFIVSVLLVRSLSYCKHITTESVPFALGLSTGMLGHIFIDMFYFRGVVMMWPFSTEEYGRSLLIVNGHELTPFYEKMFQATDYFFEIFLFYLPLIYVMAKSRYDKENEYQRVEKKKFYYRFIVYVIIETITSMLLVFLAFFEEIPVNIYYVLVYTPGTVFTLISVIAPIFLKDAVCQLTDVKVQCPGLSRSE